MPLFPDLPVLITKTAFTALEVDRTTTATSYENLLTQEILTQEGSFLVIRASFSTSDSASLSSQNSFRVTVDGNTVALGGAEIFTCIQSGSICTLVGPLTAGPHTVNLDWQTAAGNTLRCRPVTQDEQASLLTTEET
jgi:hypothetical protein